MLLNTIKGNRTFIAHIQIINLVCIIEARGIIKTIAQGVEAFGNKLWIHYCHTNV